MPNTREKLIEALEGLLVDYGATAIFFTKGEAEVIADHLIANGVTVQEWISVKDRLPERNMQCVCRYVFGNDTQSFFQVLDYFATDKQPHFQHELGGSRMRVTHWMPLPQPPEED